MPLSQRPWSLNSFALPLVWYRCHCVDLREGDVARMSSIVKSWLYADTLEKPEELVMITNRREGGLGVHHVKTKAMALLIRSFLETAVSEKFIRNYYHEALFKWHIQDFREIEKPGFSPYYSGDFFTTIKEVYEKKGMGIKSLSSKDWYELILEKNVTSKVNDSGVREKILTRMEIKHPGVDWERSWETLNLKGLCATKITFLLKSWYNILPTKVRLHRLGLANSPLCELCLLGDVEDLEHALLGCTYNSFVNDWVIAVIIDIDPSLVEAELSSENIITLNIEIKDDRRFAVAWFLTTVLNIVWQTRQSRKPVSVTKIRAYIGAEVTIMGKTNSTMRNTAKTIEAAINFTVC